jgi:hypothetical protein
MIRKISFILALSVMAPVAWGQSALPEIAPSPYASFRYYRTINIPPIVVPTVMEVSVADMPVERLQYAISDITSGTQEPYHLGETSVIPVSISSPDVSGEDRFMGDNDGRTYAEFPLYESEIGLAAVILTSQNPVRSSALTVLLDSNVALPTFVEIKAEVGGQNRVVVARKKMTSQVINFPETSSARWTIKFEYNQPLRISEIYFNQSNPSARERTVRFLALPGHSYRIYFDADRYVNTKVGESGNLAGAPGVREATLSFTESNPEYVVADGDKDTVPDVRDNCVSLANPDQADIDGNGRGDVCDDYDQDAVVNAKDNCPDYPNRSQKDTDGDGIGDDCDDEESRLTEKHAWLPWIGMGFAALVLLGLFIVMAKTKAGPAAPTRE